MRMLPIIGVAIAAIVVLIAMTFFRVDERQQALVLQFGQVKQAVTEPGLGWKVPLIQDVVYYEDRILPLETDSLEVTPADERRLIVDAFARWRIADVVQFRQSVQTEANAMLRLERILNAALREVLGSVQSSDVLSPERTVLMTNIRDAARKEAEALGVQIIDVRIRRADLPEQNLQATFNRMEAEREREAADERARGKERAQEVRATADREALELVSDAQRQADIIRGQADAERNAIFADAFGRDEEFFAFYRSLRAYERALRGDNSTLVISPDSEFFDYLQTDRGRFSPAATQPVVIPEVGVAGPEDTTGAAPAGSGEDAAGSEAPDTGGAVAGPPSTAEAADDAAEDDAAEDEEVGASNDGAGGIFAGEQPDTADTPAAAETVTETVDGVTVTRTVDDGDGADTND